MKQITGKANSTEKALEILLSFTPYNQEMGTVEISQKLGFHKATVSRILHTLTNYGLLQQDAKTRKFRLGQSAINLGLAVNRSINSEMVLLGKPYIDALRDALKETVVLELVSGRSAVIAYIAEGSGPIRIKGAVGDRRPVHAAAGAKAILAFSPPEMKEQLLKEEMKQLTPNTSTDVKVLLDPAPAKELPNELLQACNFITPNETEAQILTGIKINTYANAKKAAEILLEKGVQAVIIKMSNKGSYYYDRSKEIIFPAYDVNAIDTVAAGDAFNGGFAAAFSEGKPIEEVLQWANACGALSTTKPGAQPSMPSRQELISFMKKNTK